MANDRRVLLGLVALGVALRLYQWAADGSLWLDEISLARNFAALSLAELVTQPLAYDQVAPRGFLAVVKLTTMLFGMSERVLWLIPLASGIAGLLLFRKLAERAMRGLAVPIAVALFALGLAPLRYSAEVKQYGLDMTAAIALTLIAIDVRARDHSSGRLLLYGLAGFAITWVSQASAIVMAALGAALAAAWLLDRDLRTRRALLVTIPVWAVSSVLAIWIGERSMTASTRAFMQDFWRGGFLPLPVRPGASALWLWERLTSLYSDPWTLRLPLAWAFAVLALAGVVALWRRDRAIAMMIAAPFVLTVIAACAQRYPFRQRLMVFLVPAGLVAAAAGAGWIADVLWRRSRAAGLTAAIAALVPSVLALAEARMPVRVEHYKPLYAHLQKHRQPGDAVYVSFLANSSAIYYGPPHGLGRTEYHLGACVREDIRAFLRDVDRFRGRKRLWVIMRNSPTLRLPNAAVRRYLATVGVVRDSLIVHSGVGDPLSIELFDLSDATRLRSTSAETFPVSPMPRYPRPSCRDWSGDVRSATR
jgi:hypothetical protein